MFFAGKLVGNDDVFSMKNALDIKIVDLKIKIKAINDKRLKPSLTLDITQNVIYRGSQSLDHQQRLSQKEIQDNEANELNEDLEKIAKMEREIEYYKRNRNQQEHFIIVSLVAQAASLAGVTYTVATSRKIAIVSFYNWFLRLSQAAIILKLLHNDVQGQRCYQAIYNLGLSRTYPSNTCYVYILQLLTRSVITYASMVVITYYLFTIDEDGNESILDQVTCFASLLIMVEIDSILVGFTDPKYNDLLVTYDH